MKSQEPETAAVRDPVARMQRALQAELLRPLGLPAEETPVSEFSRPPKPEMGDLSLACFPLAKALKAPPAEIAARIAAAWPEGLPGTPAFPGVQRVAAAGPYVNLHFQLPDLARWLLPRILDGEAPFGADLPATGVKTMVEYSSPNTNKPLHLGHVRNNVLGMSLSLILEALGDEVVRVNLVNDRGIHICKTMVAYRRWGQGRTPEQAGMKPDHFVGSFYVLFEQKLKEEREAWEASARPTPTPSAADEEEDPFEAQSELMAEARECLRRWEAGDRETRELWRRMNDWVLEGFRATYERMGCRFDRWYFESETYQLGKRIVEDGLARGIFYRKPDGSVWARLEPVGLQDKLLLRRDGTSVYITQDIGTAVKKYEDERMDRSLYVVGSEQVLHFKNLFAILRLLGYPWAEGCHHVAYGLVTLPRGMGKLKSREGRTVDADTLLDELRALAREKIESAIAEGRLERDEVGDLEEAAERVGQAALKVYLLQVSAEKNIVYDPDATLSFTGDTGPAIQYSHARIHGILRKGLRRGDLRPEELSGGGTRVREELVGYETLADPHERALLLGLLEFPQKLELAGRTLSPSPLANYLLELTKTFARFYHNCPVLRAEPRELALARLQLCLATAQVLRRGLGLLTVEAPERM
jgi:arginyl-tRNA synthetase